MRRDENKDGPTEKISGKYWEVTFTEPQEGFVLEIVFERSGHPERTVVLKETPVGESWYTLREHFSTLADLVRVIRPEHLNDLGYRPIGDKYPEHSDGSVTEARWDEANRESHF